MAPRNAEAWYGVFYLNGLAVGICIAEIFKTSDSLYYITNTQHKLKYISSLTKAMNIKLDHHILNLKQLFLFSIVNAFVSNNQRKSNITKSLLINYFEG